MKPLISVIIPTLNEEKYLEKTIHSIKNQKTSCKKEIIVVDGRSKDNTIKIARRLADKVIVSPRRNPGFQRNLGAKDVRGEILVFLDADTEIVKNWIESAIRSLNTPDIVAAIGPLYPLEEIREKYFYSLSNNLQKTLVKMGLPMGWGASFAVKKETFFGVGGFDESLRTTEDHDLFLRLRNKGRVVFNDQMISHTSHRRFLQGEKTLTWNIHLLIEYFVSRHLRKYKTILKRVTLGRS